MKIVMLHPDFKRLGGIETFIEKLKSYFKCQVEYFSVGKKYQEKGCLEKSTRILFDYWLFFKKGFLDKVDIVHLNPSLEKRSFIRDGIFLVLSKIKHKKTFTIFHGWDPEFQKFLSGRGSWLFKMLYGKNDAFMVLSESYREILLSWGVKQPIYVGSTNIDDRSLDGFDIELTISQRIESKKFKILFISRIFKEKGIFEVIDTFGILKEKYSDIELYVVGDGVDLENACAKVEKEKLSGVVFTGDVRGSSKYQIFKDSHLLCFPTYHNEGFPSCVVESMAFGLPIVTRPLGGIKDFFINGENGYVTQSMNPEDFAKLVEQLMVDKNLYKKVAYNNYRYAGENFLASKAASRIEGIYSRILNGASN